jgi:hypothetical protein
MPRIFVPSGGPPDWQRLLAEPDRHWRKGFSAMSLAHSWEAADGLPPEVAKLFRDHPDFHGVEPELLAAFPEWQVPLPGGKRASQNDVFVLARCGERTIAIMVEGKVAESFGPTLGEWLADSTDGKRTRLEFLRTLLGIRRDVPADIRYQLLHRTASALIEARRFGTDAAATVVHSFSPDSFRFDDFAAFCRLLGATPEIGRLACVRINDGMPLYLGWAKGDSRRSPLA